MTDHETPIELPPYENLPSQDLTAERAVDSGGIMLSRDALDECLEHPSRSDFLTARPTSRSSLQPQHCTPKESPSTPSPLATGSTPTRQASDARTCSS